MWRIAACNWGKWRGWEVQNCAVDLNGVSELSPRKQWVWFRVHERVLISLESMRGTASKADRYQLDYINLCTSVKLRFKLQTVGGTDVKPLKWLHCWICSPKRKEKIQHGCTLKLYTQVRPRGGVSVQTFCKNYIHVKLSKSQTHCSNLFKFVWLSWKRNNKGRSSS